MNDAPAPDALSLGDYVVRVRLANGAERRRSVTTAARRGAGLSA